MTIRIVLSSLQGYTTFPDMLDYPLSGHTFLRVCPASGNRHAEVLRQLSREVNTLSLNLCHQGNRPNTLSSLIRCATSRAQAHLILDGIRSPQQSAHISELRHLEAFGKELSMPSAP
jgi:hypothetical protein